MGAADFVNNEIKELLQNGIIRPSRSPYNSPAWVVDKKGTDDNGSKKKRLVIDLRKLNERTIADRYRMPSIPMILANLGKAQFFTTLDLKLAIISIILLFTASARITDYSHAKYIPVLDGNVLIWEQYGLVRHSTNLSEFSSIIDSTVSMLELFPHSHLRKLLEVDIEHAQNHLEELKIHHRMARSIDFLGS
ncbi:hypothetical protein KR074_007370 [Drosophila pseudoananassae]|nr:hypothetical protein KR074_007370 [Drosophila pseudoananassae]